MAFVKLDCGILDSSLWMDVPAREIFVTALCMAIPFDTAEAMAQLEVSGLNPTGWQVPPGEYGFVRAAGAAIVKRSCLEELIPNAAEVGIKALERLGAPEANSRSAEHEGRRMVRVDGGFIVLNYWKYRDKDYTGAERQARFRDRRRNGNNTVTDERNGVTGRDVTHAEEEVEAEKKKNKEKERAIGAPEGQEGKRLRMPRSGDEVAWKALGKRFNVETTPGEGWPAYEQRVTEAVRKAGA